MLWIEPVINCPKVKSILDLDQVLRIEFAKFSVKDRSGHSIVAPRESFNLASTLWIFSKLIIVIIISTES